MEKLLRYFPDGIRRYPGATPRALWGLPVQRHSCVDFGSSAAGRAPDNGKVVTAASGDDGGRRRQQATARRSRKKLEHADGDLPRSVAAVRGSSFAGL